MKKSLVSLACINLHADFLVPGLCRRGAFLLIALPTLLLDKVEKSLARFIQTCTFTQENRDAALQVFLVEWQQQQLSI